MSEAEVRSQYDRWLRGSSLSRYGYAFLASVPGLMLINTPAYKFGESLMIRPEHRLLDLGCGRGSLLQVLAARIPFATPPTGLDLSGEMLRLARADAARGGGSAIDLVQGSGLRLPLAGDLFDIATCGYLVKHLSDSDLARLMSELKRVLKPGGFAVLWEFAPTRSDLLNAWNRWVLTRGVQSCNLRTQERLASVAMSAGFDWVDNARLRPFLFPPIPRASLIVGKAPESWRERTGPGRARRTAIEQMVAPATSSAE